MRKVIFTLGLASGAVAQNPISRVAELLQGLSKKIETDGKAEEKLFTKYKCWYKQTTADKTASNKEAEARIETLEAFIDDVKNGRIEFTTERQDREKELASIIAQMEKAKALREQENKDFEAAKDEMNKAITALSEAVSILADAAPVQGSFLARRFNQRKALELSKTQLSTADYKFLERALDVPEKDWEKLNRKATFKNKYGARSGEIQGTLKSMLKTFEDNLADAQRKEDDARDTYEKLRASKQTERDEAEAALLELKEEGGARAMNLEDAETEKTELETQVSNDKKYIQEVQNSYDAKLAEFKERKRLRTEEVASISQAIGILRSDDARDLFNRSFASQGYFFLQEGKKNQKMQKALNLIYESYRKNGASQQQMAAIASRLARAVEGVDEVIVAIDEMLTELQKESDNDGEWKEECEEFTFNNKKEALKHSREMDDQTATVERKVARIAELNDKIAENEKQIDSINKQLEEAKRVREDENREYKVNKADDNAAVGLISKAIVALEKFYKDNAAAMSALQTSKQAPGEAPAPPPSTWEGGYGGEKDEHNGVVGILTLIKEDVEKDIRVATEAEDKSEAAYQAFKSESEADIQGLEDGITNFEKARGQAELAKTDAEAAHASAKALLDSTIAKFRAKEADCNFIAVNFGVRKDNRQAEVDGLKKAKTILQGGSA